MPVDCQKLMKYVHTTGCAARFITGLRQTELDKKQKKANYFIQKQIKDIEINIKTELLHILFLGMQLETGKLLGNAALFVEMKKQKGTILTTTGRLM